MRVFDNPAMKIYCGKRNNQDVLHRAFSKLLFMWIATYPHPIQRQEVPPNTEIGCFMSVAFSTILV